MKTEDKYNFFQDWQKLWISQSKEFFESAEKNLKDIFNAKTFNPEEQMDQIQEWIESFKKQWEMSTLTTEEKAYRAYMKVMTEVYNNAANLLQKNWIKRIKNQKPITNVRELYELWLDCCQEVYEEALRSKAYQEAFTEFMNSAFKLWKSSITK